MSGQFKDGKLFKPKPKAPKRKTADELFAEHNTALLLQKINLLQQNIADELLNDQVRVKKIIERAINLVTLHPFEMLLKLASTELHLETTLFLYEETYKQKEFLEAEYFKLGKKRLANASNIAKGKVKQQYTVVKDTAKQVLDEMEEKNFKLFGKKMRAKLPNYEIPSSTLRKYYLEITELKSTK
jgi:hypothetical protein